MSGLVSIVAAGLGLAVAPTLRRAVDQVPGRHPLFRTPGPGDGRALQARTLIPVLSWFAEEPAGTRVLVGSPDDRVSTGASSDSDSTDSGPTDTDHSRGGHDRNSVDGRLAEEAVRRWRAPAIDLCAALLLGVLAHRIGWTWALPAFLVFGAALVVVAVIDIDHYRIPDRVVFPALGACTALLAMAAIVDGVPRALLAAAVGAVAYFAFLFVFFFIWPAGMGFGDVKLALLLGLHLGWVGSVVAVDGELMVRGLASGLQLVLMGALAGSLLGSLIGVAVLLVVGRKGAFPFGPALCLGAVIAMIASETIVT